MATLDEYMRKDLDITKETSTPDWANPATAPLTNDATVTSPSERLTGSGGVVGEVASGGIGRFLDSVSGNVRTAVNVGTAGLFAGTETALGSFSDYFLGKGSGDDNRAKADLIVSEAADRIIRNQDEKAGRNKEATEQWNMRNLDKQGVSVADTKQAQVSTKTSSPLEASSPENNAEETFNSYVKMFNEEDSRNGFGKDAKQILDDAKAAGFNRDDVKFVARQIQMADEHGIPEKLGDKVLSFTERDAERKWLADKVWGVNDGLSLDTVNSPELGKLTYKMFEELKSQNPTADKETLVSLKDKAFAISAVAVESQKIKAEMLSAYNPETREGRVVSKMNDGKLSAMETKFERLLGLTADLDAGRVGAGTAEALLKNNFSESSLDAYAKDIENRDTVRAKELTLNEKQASIQAKGVVTDKIGGVLAEAERERAVVKKASSLYPLLEGNKKGSVSAAETIKQLIDDRESVVKIRTGKEDKKSEAKIKELTVRVSANTAILDSYNDPELKALSSLRSYDFSRLMAK